MDPDLMWIKKALVDFGERKPGFRYPEEFKRRVVRYGERRLKTTTTTTLAREVGLSWVTMKRWQEVTSTAKEPVRVEAAPQAMVPVRITGHEWPLRDESRYMLALAPEAPEPNSFSKNQDDFTPRWIF